MVRFLFLLVKLQNSPKTIHSVYSYIILLTLLLLSILIKLPTCVLVYFSQPYLIFNSHFGGGLFMAVSYFSSSLLLCFSYGLEQLFALILGDYDRYFNAITEFHLHTRYRIDPINYGYKYIKNNSETNFLTLAINNCTAIVFNSFNFDESTSFFVRSALVFLLSTVISLLFSSYIGLYGVFVLNFVPLVLFWYSSFNIFCNSLLTKTSSKVSAFKWFNFNFTEKIHFDIYIDIISISFSVLTLTIALFVYIYCFSYFRGEPNTDRLMLFINLFVVSMIILVTSGNLFVLFLGWELIGLTSFLLINFWSTRVSTLKSAFKAFSFNKLSDVFILLSCLTMFCVFGSADIATIVSSISSYSYSYVSILGFEVSSLELISAMLLSAAFIKSAQFMAHIWLPDSMEAPVPASALIHSATLVSAGVFVLLRFSPIFELSYCASKIIPVVSSFTAFFGGVVACYQSDCKKILAYSTISHCGFMMLCFSTGSIEYTLLYLYIHGFFKASSFLCVGNIIRISNNYQDFRKMGSFFRVAPFEFYMLVFSLANLCGLPFTLGFFIKHLLLLGLPEPINIFIKLNVIGGALSGILYCFRLIYYIFFDTKKGKKHTYTSSLLLQDKRNFKFFSSNGLASNVAILALNIAAYVISLYLAYYLYSGKGYISDIEGFSHVNSSKFNLNILSDSAAYYLGYINWLILLALFLVIAVRWRYSYKGWSLTESYSTCALILLIVLLFFYVVL